MPNPACFLAGLLLLTLPPLLLSQPQKPPLAPLNPPPVLPRDRLSESVNIHDLPTVTGLINAHNDGVLLMGHAPVDVDRVDTLGRTVLHMCGTDPQSSSKAVIDVSCARIAKLLIGAGFDGDRRCDEGWRPVDVYAALGLPETVAVLVASGVVVNTWDYVYGRSPLMRAAMNGMKTTVKVLVEGGAKVDYRSGDGSAVTVAVRNEVMGKINMPPKATPSETTSETTPRASSSHDWDEFVERQEATFADTCDPTARGTQDVVDYGCEPGKEYFAIVDYLLAAGADPNFPEEATGRTPIMMASKAGHERLVARLLETEKVDLQIADKDGFGAITYAETDEIRDMLVDYLVRTIN